MLAYGGYLDFSIQFTTLPGYERFTLTEEIPIVVIQVGSRQSPNCWSFMLCHPILLKANVKEIELII